MADAKWDKFMLWPFLGLASLPALALRLCRLLYKIDARFKEDLKC